MAFGNLAATFRRVSTFGADFGAPLWLVEEAIADFKKSEDIVAIVAINAAGKEVLTFGKSPVALTELFSTQAGTLKRTDAYITSWAKAFVETNTVGSVAVVVSTRRLVNSRALLRRVEAATGTAGLLALLGGVGFVVYFTRAILARDKQLADYAAGLEQMVAKRTAELDKANQGMRLVLNNVAQGLLTVDLDGKLAPERSAIVQTWFGKVEEGNTFQALIEPLDHRVAGVFAIGLEQLKDGFLPAEVALDQMPKRVAANARQLDLSYIRLGSDETPTGLLLVISDITEQLAHERAEREQREMMRIFQRIAQDRVGVVEFLNEGQTIVDDLCAGATALTIEKRLVHTLKGICALFGIDSISSFCHHLETAIDEEARALSDTDRQNVKREWERAAGAIRELLGDRAEKAVAISMQEHKLLIERLRKNAPVSALERWISSWTMDPVGLRFNRFAEQAQTLAQRLGKAKLECKVEDRGLRLDPAMWAPFWNAFTHLIRNSVDHGVETTAQRRAANKPETATLRLDAFDLSDSFELRVEDDGRGIDWDVVGAKAKALGLACTTQQDLEAALFHDGVSTAESVTMTSGRGVGLAAVKAATHVLGGKVKIASTKGRGTTFMFSFPKTNSVFGAYQEAAA